MFHNICMVAHMKSVSICKYHSCTNAANAIELFMVVRNDEKVQARDHVDGGQDSADSEGATV